jgi:hypothetical protein
MADLEDFLDPGFTDEPNWIKDENGITEHLDGVPWHQAKRPWRWHFCTAQTRGTTTTGHVPVDRCRCGAIRMMFGPWIDKNSRRIGGR